MLREVAASSLTQSKYLDSATARGMTKHGATLPAMKLYSSAQLRHIEAHFQCVMVIGHANTIR